MAIRCTKKPLLLTFVGALLLLGASGCVRSQPVTYNAPEPERVTARQFGRTETGVRYYVDSRGVQHVIAREVSDPSAGGGIYYYVENDEHPYFLDASGQLYYRDPWGRIYPIEAINPGNVAYGTGPYVGLPYGGETYGGATYGGAVQGAGAPMMEPAWPATTGESCASQYEKCMSGCQGISPRQAYDRPNCISNCEVIRSQCLNRQP